MIASFAFRWKYIDPPGVAINCNVHEDVEANGNVVACDPESRQCIFKIAMTAAMWMLMSIDDPERIDAARCQQEVVASHRVFDHTEHDVTSIGIEVVSLGQEDRVGVVDRSSRRKILAGIFEVVADEVGDLFSFDVGDLQALTFL